MRLSPGVKLGPYEILAPLGAGGMGEVYKARDSRLDRFVAVKVLPEHIAKRADLRSRFEREARAVASLNHPHICVLHDIGNQDGADYMVMEMLEGETLAARIEKGALPLDQTLLYGRQIADALDRAHRAGVTHRDIKPANVMVTRDGVKVMDFGLAKSAPAKPGPTTETLTAALTTEGTVLGTPQYMSPEQFEGREADPRSDIWAFGAVLYEMLSGAKAFQGKNYTGLIGAILAADPPPMNPAPPAWLDRLVRRCMAKDPEDRWQSMRDIVLEMRMPPEEIVPAPPPNKWLPWIIAAAAALAAIAATGVVLTRSSKPDSGEPIEFHIKAPAGVQFLTVSPDGKLLAWRDTTRRIAVRSLDSANIRLLPESASGPMSWSPDSRNIVFVNNAGALTKVDIATSTSLVITTGLSSGQYGTAWLADGTILVGDARGPLRKVRASGGQLTQALPLDEKNGEFAHRFPVALPDGKTVMYQSPPVGSYAGNGIFLARLDGSVPPRRIHRLSQFCFSPPNRLLVLESGKLMAIPINLTTGESGDPVVIAGEASEHFGISFDNRILAFHAGGTATDELLLMDRDGTKTATIPATPSDSAHVEFSPDGRRLLLERLTGDNLDLWTVELARSIVSRLTFHDETDGPGVWSSDGQKVYFRSIRPGTGPGIYEIAANGIGGEKLVHKVATHHMHASPDGRYLLFERLGLAFDTVDLKSGNKQGVYLEQPGGSPQFSPDSRFVAYESTETGQREIYVQTFPAGGGKWQVSNGGGIEPRWRGDGKELFFDKGDGTIMAATVETRGGSLQIITVKELFRFSRGRTTGTAYAVTPDGKTFAIRQTPAGGEATITVRVNPRLPK